MSKKTIIILSLLIFAILAVGAFYLYDQDFFNPLTPAKLSSSFENRNQNLSPEVFQEFQKRFGETKARLQADPDSFNDWLYLGVLKKGIADYEGSRDIFLYVAKLRPENSTPLANLADLYAYFLNEPAKAEDNLIAAIAKDPSNPNLYLSLVDVYRYKFSDGAAKCEATLLTAANKFPENPNVIASVAAYFRDTNQTQKAIEWYEKLVRLAPDNEEAKADLARLKQIKN